MANVLAPSGFRAGRTIQQDAANYGIFPARIAYNNTNKIAFGDPVKLLSSGYIDVMAVGGSTIHGVFLGCDYYDPVAQMYRWMQQWPGVSLGTSSLVVTARVLVDPFATFQVQVSGGPVVQGDIGDNIDILTSTSGAPNIAGISTCVLDYSTKATTGTLPFRIVDIVRSGINSAYDPTQANNWVEVRMNTSDTLQTTGI